MDETTERRPKRQKRESSSYKAKAFEKFKQLKNKEINKYDIGEVDNIYETVDEKEYAKKVLSRQDDDWIVDDDGSGYVEDGRDIFDDDLDSESIAAAVNNSSKGKGVKRKKKAVSENAGKGNLHYMLSNMPAKKKEQEKLDTDSALSAVLEEIDDISSNTIEPKTMSSSSFSFSTTKQAEKDYMKSFSVNLKKPISLMASSAAATVREEKRPVLKETSNNYESNKKISLINKSVYHYHEEITATSSNNGGFHETNKNSEEETQNLEEIPTTPQSELEIPAAATQNSDLIETNQTHHQSCFYDDDDIDMSQIEEFQSQFETENNEIISFEDEFIRNWEGSNDDNTLNTTTTTTTTDTRDFEAAFDDASKNILRFFWWDAFEDVQKQPGVVFLFGKIYCETSKAFVSCSIAVRDIERKLFFLPRVVEEKTQNSVTTQAVYSEISEKIIKPLQITQFKARPISKKYAFDPEIPAESDYIEVRYSAKEASINSSTTGKTFSKIFGTESSYLEIFLLDRKMKGPCWLDISNTTLVTNPYTWCKLEFNCHKTSDVNITQTEQTLSPPPLIVAAINMRCVVNPKTLNNEIVMMSCVSHTKYSVDKQPPNPPFQNHFCAFTSVEQQPLPFNLHEALTSYKATTVQKMNSEKALLNYFINQFIKIDADLVVGHDLQGYQINILCDRLNYHNNSYFSKLGRIKRSVLIKQKLEKTLFVGRLVCDIKTATKELIKCRSYDLDTLSQTVLKIKEGQRIDLEPEDIPKMFQNTQDILKLISLTMQDTSYTLKIMYSLNIIPLALQITNIAGNVMSRTLIGGRSERNEFLLLHAFSEKGYIVPDKQYKKSGGDKGNSRKKPSYSGGLVLEPKIGFYDKFILLMDFNSLYPSIIQEYNICFTTMPLNLSEENMILPDKSLPSGILPTEIRKLVESRREVKKLMNNPDISNDLKMQYNIRQMALKLTANSMYGCLGFSNSRFYAKNLASLITHKGREILTNTRDLVQKNYYEVIYGDTDSIMINTNIVDYDEVFQIGNKLKHEINKLYKQIELDIDGVFKYLLLLKKKKYAAVTLTKTKTGQLKTETEYKGLDIVRRDWSQLSCGAGHFILDQIFKDQTHDERISNIHAYLLKLKQDLKENKVPLSLLIITKQLTKNPVLYADKKALPHVQVALRYNEQFGGHYRAGDTVPYIICDDGTNKSSTERAYHVEELKNSQSLKVDVSYYLSQQIHPVITRICEPIEGMDAYQIADWLGMETSSIKKPREKSDMIGENFTKPEIKFRNVEKFIFKCVACRHENRVNDNLNGEEIFLDKCSNLECKVRPIEHLGYLQNQLTFTINSYINKYYLYELICEDPMCTNEITRVPLNFAGRFPICTSCQNGVMLKKYTEFDLYSQLSYFHHIFDLSKMNNKPIMEYQIENGYHSLRETVENYLNHCAYSVINLSEMFSGFFGKDNTEPVPQSSIIIEAIEEIQEEEEY